jgi:hypothetical protein
MVEYHVRLLICIILLLQECLPLEIVAHIGCIADLRSTANLRSTCRPFFEIISNKIFTIYNIREENVQLLLRPLGRLKQISIEFRNVPKKSIDDPLPIFKEIGSLDIHRLNINDFLHMEALTRLAHLNNTLESLEANNVRNDVLDQFYNLKRLVLSNSTVQLGKLTKLEELHLVHSDYIQNVNAPKLTKLVIKYGYNLTLRLFNADKNKLQNLKSLEVFGSHFSYVPCLTTLESLTTDGRINSLDISSMTKLTRLELSGTCFGREEDPEDLANWTRLTKLKVLHITDTINKFVKSIAFMSKLPLTAATISGVTRDDAECIQHLKPHLIHELSVDINNSSMFKQHLTRLSRLEALTVRSSTPVVVDGIDTLTLLTRLVLVKSQCKFIERLTQLQVLRADLTPTNMSGWTALMNLHQFDATVPSQSIENIALFTKLEDLVLKFSEAFDSNALSSLTNLTRICLPGLNYSTLDWLAPLTKLECLNLQTSPISARDLEALTKLGNLTKLVIQNAYKYRDGLTALTKLQAFQ